MNKANELAYEFPEQNMLNLEHDAVTKLNGWGIKAVDMLRSQAKEIEQLKKERDALKADAERYQWLRKHVVFGYCSPEGCDSDDVYLTVTGYKTFPQIGKTVDAAIDAMKGKS